jgi:hypothetical protein
MHVSLLPTSRPPPPGPALELLEQSLSWLRAELDLSKSAEQSAALHHEIGALEELAGHDSVAVRELLAAVNTVASFREPLERLIAIVERHRSFKNLPTLLDHLCRIAAGPDEQARALLARAWYQLRHRDDHAAALQDVLALLAVAPHEPAALVTLELLGSRLGRPELIERSLAVRAELAPATPAWRALLLIDLAQLQHERGDAALAKATLERALALETDQSWAALGALEAIAERTREPGALLQVLRARAQLLLEPGARLGTPAFARATAHASELLLRSARLEHAAGDSSAALATLERALGAAPHEPALRHAALRIAASAGQHETAERHALAEIAAGYTPGAAAALWIDVAEARLERGLVAGAAAALESALTVDPESLLAQALELDVLTGMGAASMLGEVFARIAPELVEPSARARAWLLAAESRARGAHDARAAQYALEQAREAGVPAGLALRIARALAHSIGDRDWYDAASRELLEADPDVEVRTRLRLELLRSAMLRGDGQRAAELREAIAGVPEHAHLAWLLGAYALAPGAAHERAQQLLALAAQDAEPRRALVLRWLALLERSRAGAQDEALAALKALYDEHPEDAVLAGTLSGWLESSDERQTLLRRAAHRLDDAPLAASLAIEAGLTSFRAGERLLAIGDFESALRLSPDSAAALEAWARRACRRSDAVSDWSTSSESEQLVGLLQRLAAPDGARQVHASALERALASHANRLPPALLTAANLAHLLFAPPPNGRPSSLQLALSQHPDHAELASAWAYFAALARGDEASLLELKAKAWADLNPSLVSALEWFGASQRNANTPDEWRARRLIAELLPRDVGALVEAGAALVRYVASGDLPQLVEATRPELALVNLELAPPGCDPRRRLAALEPTGDVLGDEDGALASLLIGYNQLALGERAAAAASFLRYATAFPDDPMGWEGLIATSDEAKDPVLLAEATAALGNATTEPAYGAELFERAADILSQRLDDAVASEAALERAVELDINRRSSFDKLLAIVKRRGDNERTLELIGRRIGVAMTPEERALLLWDRARSSRASGDIAGATEALQSLTELRPDHVGARMLLGEIHITDQRYEAAADELARISALPAAPLGERLASGIAAVDLLENKLGNTARAFEVLLGLQSAGLGTLAVRERLARAAAKAGAWDEASLVLEQLMFERETADERSEAARLALAIHRDQRQQPAKAARAAEVLLALTPDDPEALELVLAGNFEPALTERLLKQGRSGLLGELQYQPIDFDRIRLLARVAERSHDRALRQVALGALVAYGQTAPGVLDELTLLDAQLLHTPQVAIDKEWLQRLKDPDDGGPLAELLQSIAPELVRALGPLPTTFNAARKNRVAPGSGLPLRNDVAAWAGAFELGEFELHIADVPTGRIRALGTEPPTFIVGPGVESPLGPAQRLDLVREIYALKRGIGFVLHQSASDAAALVVAVLELDGASVGAPHYARLDDFKRQLTRALSKSERKLVSARLAGVKLGHAEIVRWIEACGSTLDRIAALAVGDPSWVVARIENDERGAQREPAALSVRSRRVLGFALSAGFAELRDKLGMTRR